MYALCNIHWLHPNHSPLTIWHFSFWAQELYESQGGHPGLPIPNCPYALSLWATFEHEEEHFCSSVS